MLFVNDLGLPEQIKTSFNSSWQLNDFISQIFLYADMQNEAANDNFSLCFPNSIGGLQPISRDTDNNLSLIHI